jgi:hypothetical protein
MLKAVVRAVTTVLQRVKGHYNPDPLECTPENFIYQPQGTMDRVLSAYRSGVCRASTCRQAVIPCSRRLSIIMNVVPWIRLAFQPRNSWIQPTTLRTGCKCNVSSSGNIDLCPTLIFSFCNEKRSIVLPLITFGHSDGISWKLWARWHLALSDFCTF